MKFLIVALACLFSLSLMSQNKTLDTLLKEAKGKEGISEIEALLLKGINAKNKNGTTPLMLVSSAGHTKMGILIL